MNTPLSRFAHWFSWLWSVLDTPHTNLCHAIYFRAICVDFELLFFNSFNDSSNPLRIIWLVNSLSRILEDLFRFPSSAESLISCFFFSWFCCGINQIYGFTRDPESLRVCVVIVSGCTQSTEITTSTDNGHSSRRHETILSQEHRNIQDCVSHAYVSK